MSAFLEYKELRFPRDARPSDIRALLTSMAEVERWELDQVRVFASGRRYVRLRRKSYNMRLTA